MFTKSEKRIVGLILLFFIVGYTSQKISEGRVKEFKPPPDRIVARSDGDSPTSGEKNIIPSSTLSDTLAGDRDSIKIEGKLPQNNSQGAFPININTAGEKDWVRIKGIGPKTAQKIIQYRQENGPFKTISGLMKVKGIGPKKLEKVSPYLTLGSD